VKTNKQTNKQTN